MSRYTGGGGYLPLTPTTPATIFGSNLVAWYDANVGVTLSGSNLVTWADQSGNGNTLTQSATAATFSATGFNGKPGITCSNSPATGSIVTGNVNINSTTASWFFVGNITNAGSRILDYYDTTGSDANATSGSLILSNSGTVNILSSFQGAQNGNFTITHGANQRLCVTCNGPLLTNGYSQYVNNVLNSSFTLTNNTMGNANTVFNIAGTNAVGSAAFTVAEVVFTNNAASSAQLNSMDAYLKNKWGL